MDGREATTVAGLAAFAGLPAALVATSTRAEDVCARARTTRSASAASLSAIGGDMVRARVTCARASRTPRKRSPCDLAGHRGRETWDPFDPFDSFGLVRDDWPNLPVCEPKLRCRFKAENDEDLVGCCPRTARIYQKVGIGRSGASVEPRASYFRVKRAAGELRVALGVGFPVGKAVQTPVAGLFRARWWASCGRRILGVEVLRPTKRPRPRLGHTTGGG